MPPPSLRLAVAASLLLAVAHPAAAWLDSGHMVVAQIAVDDLDDGARREAARLLALLDAGTPVTASTWLDAIKDDFRLFDPWHYINLPYAVDGLPPSPPGEQNLVSAIDAARATLANRDADDTVRALALALLLHLVGDIHQPLHCVSRISARHPGGDRGGNDFAIAHRHGNLHRLWDATADRLPDLDPALPATADAVRRLADQVVAAVPRARLPQWTQTSTSAWAEDSHALARDAAYAGIEEGAAPSPAYLERVQALTFERLALAGYRLGALLDDSLGSE